MNSRGFTLIEVMVAIGISVLVATVAYQSLSVAGEATQRSSAAAKRIDSISRVWQILETDIRQTVERGGKNALGFEFPSLEGGDDSEYLLSFVRGGWANPLEQVRSSLQRVGYKVEDEILWRYYWYAVDGSAEETPQKLDLLDKVKSMEMRFLPKSATGIDAPQWQPLWPVRGSAQSQLPAAVEVSIELENLGEIKRTFVFASG